MSVIMETNVIRENVLNNLTNKLNGVNLVIVYFEVNNTYVNLKTKLSESLGVNVRTYLLDSKVDNKYVLDLINEFNNDNMVDGIIVQLPLPENLDKDKILNSICWYKDVDGISSISVNRYLCKKECIPPINATSKYATIRGICIFFTAGKKKVLAKERSLTNFSKYSCSGPLPTNTKARLSCSFNKAAAFTSVSNEPEAANPPANPTIILFSNCLNNNLCVCGISSFKFKFSQSSLQ